MEANELVKWPNTKPESLQDLCVFYVVNNVRQIVESTTYRLMRTSNITLPHTLGNQLLDYLINCCLPDISYLNRNQIEDIQIFFNKNFTDISSIDLHSCNIQTIISLGVLDALKEHRLNEITWHCPLSGNEVAAFTSLVQSQVNSLEKLTIPDTPSDILRQIFLYEEDNHPQPSVGERDVFKDLSIVIEDRLSLESSSQHPMPRQKMLIFPNLTSLHLYTCDPCSSMSFFGEILRKHKTLSSCGIYTTTPLYDQPHLHMKPISSMFLVSLPHLTNLSSLCFVQCSLRTVAFEYLSILKNLRHLDISFCTMEDGRDMESGHIHLMNLVQRLPKLVSLDISYTRLGGIIQSLETHGEVNPGETAVLPGLEGRRFEFLGLWKVIPEVYELKNIPAKRVSTRFCKVHAGWIAVWYEYQHQVV
ncbi:hypothetical protein CHS0354_002350 [Potamilus streckersoni]|uniref:Zer-1-like leucine-rich repeats region domain-containing protein n=1 Tax=Potamilus streckersoni TaxID=2493646 RepID=A0AAE0VZM9_9BIVA|nr:hypothetical protein CHS0354_002350 [Potamilus streckersoni]